MFSLIKIAKGKGLNNKSENTERFLKACGEYNMKRIGKSLPAELAAFFDKNQFPVIAN
jgi:hypothetical protein